MSKLIRADSEVVALYLRTLYVRQVSGEGEEAGAGGPPRRGGGRRTRVIR